MSKFIASACAAVLAIHMAIPAQANDALPKDNEAFGIYDTVGDWTIYTIKSRKSCLAEKLFGNGELAMQMGATRDQSKGYLGVFTTEDVELRRKQKVMLDIDGQSFESTGIAKRTRKLRNGYRGGYIAVTSKALADALADGHTLVVTPARTQAFELSLDGLGKAMEVGARCIREQN